MKHRLTAGIALVAAFALAGCSGTTAPGTGTDSPLATTGETDGSAPAGAELVLPFLGGIATPDPDTAYDGSELNLVNSAYEGLVGYVPGQAEPELTGVLATDWTVSDDGLVYTFDLRPDVTFHDGTPFDSSAIQASFDRRLAVDQGPAYMVFGIASIETPSPEQVVVTLEQPNAAFLDLLASPFGPKMISPTALAEHADDNGLDWFNTHDAGTGPYTYGTFEEGVSYELLAYPDYWGEAPGYAKITFPVVANMSTLQLQLEAGDVDGIVGYADTTVFDTLAGSGNVATYAFPSMQTPTLFVNPASPELADQETRVALLGGVDWPAVAEGALGSVAEPTDEVFPKNLLPPDVNTQAIEHDPDALADLAAGPLAGGTITIGYAAVSPAAQALSDHLAAALNTAGIAAESVGYAAGTYYTALEDPATAPDVTFFTGFPDTAAPEAWARVFYTPSGGLDLFGAEVDGVSDLLDEALVTGDTDTYGEVAQLVSTSGYWYSVATSLGTAIFQKDVAGVETSWNPVITGVLDLKLLHPAG